MSKKLFLINKEKVLSGPAGEFSKEPICYYLSSDYSYFIKIKNNLANIKVFNLESKFRNAVKELWEPYLELSAELNNRNDSLEWWGSTIASRNSASTPLFLNIVYLYCADKILLNADKDVLLIADSEALFDSIEEIAAKRGYQTIYVHGKRRKVIEKAEISFKICAKISLFLWRSVKGKVLISLMLRKKHKDNCENNKIAVIRSWVNQSNFGINGSFKDRNFGDFSTWLSSRGYAVWILPMFFDLSMPLRKMLSLMKNSDAIFLMPHQYLKLRDYFHLLFLEFKCLKTSFNKVKLKNHDVSKIFSAIHIRQVFSLDLLSLNLCYFMLKRLNEEGIRISTFYYPFENNPVEKLFIKGVRKFYPCSSVVAFQHTVWYTEQCGMFLSEKDLPKHPIADKIVTSGMIYLNVLKRTGFPESILASGPNLRFTDIHKNAQIIDDLNGGEKIILLPLSFERNISFELIYKVKESLEKCEGYKVYIRPHPLIPWNELKRFLGQIGMKNFKISSSGTMQEWLNKSYAVISTGCTVSILESVVMGIPTVRVTPDNYFFLDPLAWADYPIKPVCNPKEITLQLDIIDKMLRNDKNVFKRTGIKIKNDFFSAPDEKALMNFL